MSGLFASVWQWFLGLSLADQLGVLGFAGTCVTGLAAAIRWMRGRKSNVSITLSKAAVQIHFESDLMTPAFVIAVTNHEEHSIRIKSVALLAGAKRSEFKVPFGDRPGAAFPLDPKDTHKFMRSAANVEKELSNARAASVLVLLADGERHTRHRRAFAKLPTEKIDSDSISVATGMDLSPTGSVLPPGVTMPPIRPRRR